MTDPQTTTQGFPRGVPGGAEVWQVSDQHAFLVWDVPNSDPPVPLAYHVESQQDLDALFEEAGKSEVTFDRELTSDQFRQSGAIRAGTANQLHNTSKHPFESFVDTFEDEAAIRPWLKEPEMLSMVSQAILEGRSVTTAEIKNTEWWRSRTAAEREWAQLAASDPQEAQREITNTRRETRNALIEAGMREPPESLIRYYGDRLARGEISRSRWEDDIRRETDPHAPYASPFAGKRLPDDATVHQRGDGQWMIRFRDQDYRLTGPGQKARYNADPGMNDNRSISGGDYFTADGEHYLRSTTGNWYRATGPGQRENLQRLYGDPRGIRADQVGDISGSVVSLFGGPGEMEGYLERAPEAGTAMDLFELLGEEGEGDPNLPGKQTVIDEIHKWVGPAYAQNFDSEWVERWAGRLRNEGEGARDRLTETLKRHRMAAFPEYEDPELTYEDIAQISRGLVRREWGRQADETADYFPTLVRMNDMQQQRKFLRQEGRERGVQKVLDDTRRAARDAFGSQVQESVV